MADPVLVWAWILIVIGIIFSVLLVFFTEYKRKERDSVKFTAISILIASFCLGIGLHLLLVANGNW